MPVLMLNCRLKYLIVGVGQDYQVLLRLLWALHLAVKIFVVIATIPNFIKVRYTFRITF